MRRTRQRRTAFASRIRSSSRSSATAARPIRATAARTSTQRSRRRRAVLGPGTLVIPSWTADAKLAICVRQRRSLLRRRRRPTAAASKAAAPAARTSLAIKRCRRLHRRPLSQLRRLPCGRQCAGLARHGALHGGDYKTACAAALNSVSLSNKANSPIILAPTGTLTHQGGKLSAAESGRFQSPNFPHLFAEFPVANTHLRKMLLNSGTNLTMALQYMGYFQINLFIFWKKPLETLRRRY